MAHSNSLMNRLSHHITSNVPLKQLVSDREKIKRFYFSLKKDVGKIPMDMLLHTAIRFFNEMIRYRPFFESHYVEKKKKVVFCESAFYLVSYMSCLLWRIQYSYKSLHRKCEKYLMLSVCLFYQYYVAIDFLDVSDECLGTLKHAITPEFVNSKKIALCLFFRKIAPKSDVLLRVYGSSVLLKSRIIAEKSVETFYHVNPNHFNDAGCSMRMLSYIGFNGALQLWPKPDLMQIIDIMKRYFQQGLISTDAYENFEKTLCTYVVECPFQFLQLFMLETLIRDHDSDINIDLFYIVGNIFTHIMHEFLNFSEFDHMAAFTEADVYKVLTTFAFYPATMFRELIEKLSGVLPNDFRVRLYTYKLKKALHLRFYVDAIITVEEFLGVIRANNISIRDNVTSFMKVLYKEIAENLRMNQFSQSILWLKYLYKFCTTFSHEGLQNVKIFCFVWLFHCYAMMNKLPCAARVIHLLSPKNVIGLKNFVRVINGCIMTRNRVVAKTFLTAMTRLKLKPYILTDLINTYHLCSRYKTSPELKILVLEVLLSVIKKSSPQFLEYMTMLVYECKMQIVSRDTDSCNKFRHTLFRAYHALYKAYQMKHANFSVYQNLISCHCIEVVESCSDLFLKYCLATICFSVLSLRKISAYDKVKDTLFTIVRIALTISRREDYTSQRASYLREALRFINMYKEFYRDVPSFSTFDEVKSIVLSEFELKLKLNDGYEELFDIACMHSNYDGSFYEALARINTRCNRQNYLFTIEILYKANEMRLAEREGNVAPLSEDYHCLAEILLQSY